MEKTNIRKRSFSRSIFCAIVVLATLLCGLTACGDNHTHSFSMWETKTEASCTTQGRQVRECSTCGFVEEETYAKTDHDWEEATYTTPKTCKVCGLTEGEPMQMVDLTAAEIYEIASPSVVEVTAESTSSISTGTGFFIDKNGTLVTNYHVIERCKSATITLTDGRIFDVVNVLGFSESKDIAILSTDCRDSVPLEMRTTAIKTGEKVYAIGSSLGLSGSLSEGIISTAQREIAGQILIQTTAPISHGNSGGPLLDSTGMVIGITTATLTDGQNLNFAIPVSEIDNISMSTPTTLPEMFPQSVEWISEWDFFYYDDDEAFVLVFQLSDENEVPMSSRGTVDIRIVNDNDVTVYSKTHSFTENDFFEWIVDDTEELYLATINITPDAIVPGTCAEGTVYFTVYGDDYYFEESTIYVWDLPVNALDILRNHLFVYGTYADAFKWYRVNERYSYDTHDISFAITYSIDDGEVFAYMSFYNADDTLYDICLRLEKDKNGIWYSCNYYIWNDIYYDYELLNETWGYINPEEFTDKTALKYTEYEGLPNQKEALLTIYQANIQDLLDWLSLYLWNESVGIAISDFGFTVYE